MICEEIFFDDDARVSYDSEHSYDEDRDRALGRTAIGRPLFIVFTVRGRRIRPLSARDMTHHEQTAYARQEKSAEALPRFETEDAESKFWETHDSTDYIDWTKAESGTLFPNLKPTSETISLRLPIMMIAQLKTLAYEREVSINPFSKCSWQSGWRRSSIVVNGANVLLTGPKPHGTFWLRRS